MKWFLALALLSLTACSQPTERVDVPTPLQAVRFGSPAYDTVWGLTGHPAGVYVVGMTRGDLHGVSRGGDDAFVRKVDTEGRVLWAEQFGTAEAETAWGVATGVDGSVYVVGSTEGALVGSSHGGNDGFVRKYSAAGRVLWTKQFGTEEEDHLVGIATSGDAVYVVGHRTDEATDITKGLVMKLDSSGAEGWLEVFGTVGRTHALAVATDDQGNAYVVGSSPEASADAPPEASDMVLRKYAPTGATLWTKRLDHGTNEVAFGVAVSGEGVYLAGEYVSRGGRGDSDVRVAKFGADGAKLWDEPFDLGGDDYVYKLSVAADSVVFVGQTVSSAEDSDGYLIKLDPTDGGQVWQAQLATPTWDLVMAVAHTPTGVYAAGETGGTLYAPEETDAFLVRLGDAMGESLWADP